MTTELSDAINGAIPEQVKTQEPPQVEPTAELAEEPQVEEPVAEEPKAEEPVKDEPPMVPLAALTEVRRELQDLKGRLPQPEPPKVPDVFDDQQGFTSHIENKVRSAAMGTKLETSRFMAEREFGADLVKEAHAYFDANPEQSAQLLDHPSPYHAAIEFYQSQKVAEEIGSDPKAYADKVREQVRKEVEAEIVAKQAAETAAKSAPSMAGIPGVGGSPKTTWAGPTSLDSVFK